MMSYKNYFVIFVLSIFTTIYPYFANGLICKGCLELDDLTFDKVLSKFSTVLIKFDIAFPYGKKHDEYTKFAKEISELNDADFIACVVGIKNYGDSTNNKLVERFNIEDERLPTIKLFTDNDASKWIEFPKDQNITKENLRQFIRRQSNVNIALPDCLSQFDEYAIKFIDAMQPTTTSKHRSIAEAEAILNDACNEAMKLETVHERTAQIYLLIMRRVLEKDIEFIRAERMRLHQLILSGKISDQKRKEINQKLNILSAFNVIEKVMPTPHTEL